MDRFIRGASLLVPILAMACSGDRLSGPDAQAAYARARTDHRILASDVIVFVDGQRVPTGEGLKGLDPGRVRSIEIVKGPAAERLYGAEAKRGAIFIFTTADSGGQPTQGEGRPPN